jgi:SAM-dependent methyltransferase
VVIRQDKKRRARAPLTAATADRHILYTAAVQSVETDLEFFDRVYRRRNGRLPSLLKEDFCGTAAMAAEFVRMRPRNRAVGVDLHRPTLEWGRRHNLAPLGKAASRVTLLEKDVRRVHRPQVDVIAALNFSYSVFKTRPALLEYFTGACRSLRRGGVFVIDAFGGCEATRELVERRRIPATDGPGGTRVPPFTYVWDQASYNAVDHHIRCHIHFEFKDGTAKRRAFSYDWRLWSLPELQELMREAGFREVEVYLEGWDDGSDEPDGAFRRRTAFKNIEGWIGYVVGYR